MKRLLCDSRRIVEAVALILAFALVLTLGGCGEAGEPGRPPASATDGNAPAPADDENGNAEAAAPANGDDTEAPANGGDAEMVEVTFELPEALFIGTPSEPPAGTTAQANLPPRKPLMAPAGATNLALNKPVTSSDPFPIIGDLEQIVDADKAATDGSYVELGSGLQWIQIDLEAPSDIYGILLWHYHQEPRIYRDVIVQIADDADFLTNVRTVFNNDHDNSSGLGAGEDREYFEDNKGHLIYVDGKTTQYVRLYSRGNSADDQNHYIEVEVWGVPAE